MVDVKGTHEMQDGRSSPCGSLHLLEARVLPSQSQQPRYMCNCPFTHLDQLLKCLKQVITLYKMVNN